MAILLFADGGLQRYRLLGHTHNLTHLIYRHFQILGNLVRRRLTAILVQQLAVGFLYLIDGLHHVHGNTDGTGLVRNRTGNRLADPPGSIGGELEALGVVKLVHCFD